mmetsp:Transcript_12853/g.25704  ORF Transcript_12853/g.25704 Transcript_12853/m.25704 type:complete len:266 (+) Transcript_12853:364-1161(+)
MKVNFLSSNLLSMAISSIAPIILHQIKQITANPTQTPFFQMKIFRCIAFFPMTICRRIRCCMSGKERAAKRPTKYHIQVTPRLWGSNMLISKEHRVPTADPPRRNGRRDTRRATKNRVRRPKIRATTYPVSATQLPADRVRTMSGACRPKIRAMVYPVSATRLPANRVRMVSGACGPKIRGTIYPVSATPPPACGTRIPASGSNIWILATAPRIPADFFLRRTTGSSAHLRSSILAADAPSHLINALIFMRPVSQMYLMHTKVCL